MVRKYVAETIYNSFVKPVVKAFTKKQKTTGTGAINTTKPGTKLKFKRDEQDKFVKFRDNLYKSAKFDTATKNKLKSKQPLTKINKGKSDIFTPDEPKFSKGGRVGLKRGTNLIPKKKSNVQKIKETFGPKKKSTKFGMLSVKAGIDKNPNPTQADRIAGAKMKSKKRFV